jgi:ADP-heptose:LPS heptosyltransferase
MFNTPAIRQLRIRYPHARLLLIVHRKFEALVAHFADVDQVVYWDGAAKGMLRVAAELRRACAELAVILHSRTPYDVMSAVLGGCHYVLRDENLPSGRPVPMERWLAACSAQNFQGHVIQRKLNMLSVLGCRTDQPAMVPPCLVDRTHYARPDKIRIGFQLGASKPDRCWPPESFVRLAGMLVGYHPAIQIVLLGTAQERELEQRFWNALDPEFAERVDSLLGKTNMSQALDAIASLDLLVTPDTGPLHLAIALKVPTVSLFVNANPHETGPYQDPGIHRVIHQPLPDDAMPALLAAPMTHIQVETVCSAVLQALPASEPRD